MLPSCSITVHSEKNPFEESNEEETDDDISVLSQEEPVELPEEDIVSIPYKYSVLYPNDIIQVMVFYITGCAPYFYVKNKNEVIMVETTPRIFYDAMGVYYKQGYDSMNGHVMLLQAEMDRKNKSAQKKMAASETDLGHLAPGEKKKEHPVFKFPFEIEDVFYDVVGNHVTPKVYGGKISKDTPPRACFYLKRLNREAKSHPVRYQPTEIMPDNTRRRPDREEPR
jgi:hypothetical protein